MSCLLSPEESGTSVMLRDGSSFSICSHSDSHGQFWLGTSRRGWVSPGTLGGCGFSSSGDRFLGRIGTVVSKSWELVGSRVLVIFLFVDVRSGPSIRNFQDHVPGFPEVEVAAEQLVGASSEELGQSAASACVWRCWAFQQPSEGVGLVGPDLLRLGACKELVASSKPCGLQSFLWESPGTSIWEEPSMTPVNRPESTGPWFFRSLCKEVSSFVPSTETLGGRFWLASGWGDNLGSCVAWLFSGSSSVSSSEESTSRIASCFCSDSRRSARSCRRVPRAREGAGCSTPFPGRDPFPDSTLLVPTTSRVLASLGVSSFFSSLWGRSRLCLREGANFFSAAASAAASFSADCTLLSSGERGGSALLGRESCLPSGGDK